MAWLVGRLWVVCAAQLTGPGSLVVAWSSLSSFGAIKVNSPATITLEYLGHCLQISLCRGLKTALDDPLS